MPLLLVNVFVFPALLVKSNVFGNVMVRGDRVIGVLPEPVRTLPICPLAGLIRIWASAVSQPVGSNTIEMVQEAPAATEPVVGQVCELVEKSVLDPPA